MTARLAAAIVLMLGIGTAGGAELGRLFFAPEQRDTLDKMRQQNIRETTISTAPPVPQYVSVNGVLRRSDGKSTVWLNKRAVSTRRTNGINVAIGGKDNRVKLTVLESGRSFDLKVGQTIEIVSGTVEEGYARRAPSKPVAKAAPDGKKAASGAAKVTPPAASQPLKSPATAEDPTRVGEGDAQKDSRPDRAPEPKSP